MDIVVTVAILASLIVIPLLLRVNMAMLLGALAFGWVLNDVTGNDLLLLARSTLPVSRSLAETIGLSVLSFLPAVFVVLMTRGKEKNTLKMLLSLGFMPAIFVISWLLSRVSFSYDTASALRDSNVNDLVVTNQEYALWTAAIFFIAYLYSDKPKAVKDKD